MLRMAGCRRLVEVGYLLVRPIDGQRVLDQIVRADRQEVHLGGELTGDQNRGRRLDHAAEFDIRSVVDSFGVELRTHLRTEAAQRPDLVHRRHHRGP